MIKKIIDSYCSIWIYVDLRERPIIILCFLANYFHRSNCSIVSRSWFSEKNTMTSILIVDIVSFENWIEYQMESIFPRSFSGWYVIGQIYNVRMISDGSSVFYNNKLSFFKMQIFRLLKSRPGLKLIDGRYFLIRSSDRRVDHDRWVICRQIELYLALLIINYSMIIDYISIAISLVISSQIVRCDRVCHLENEFRPSLKCHTFGHLF